MVVVCRFDPLSCGARWALWSIMVVVVDFSLNRAPSRWWRRWGWAGAFKDSTQLTNGHVRLHTERLHPVFSIMLRYQSSRLMV